MNAIIDIFKNCNVGNIWRNSISLNIVCINDGDVFFISSQMFLKYFLILVQS